MRLVFTSACLQDYHRKAQIRFWSKNFSQASPIKEALFFKIKVSPIPI